MTIIFGLAAGVLILLLIIQRISLSRQLKQKDKKIAEQDTRIYNIVEDVRDYKMRLDDVLRENTLLSYETENEKKRTDKRLNYQRAILKGHLGERFIGLSEDFPYQPADMFPQSDPLDWIIIDGYSEKDAEVSIVFAEVKTGKARLTKVEQRIKAAIEEGRVSYKTFRVETPKIIVNEE